MTDIEWYAALARVEHKLKPRRNVPVGASPQARRLAERGLTHVSAVLTSDELARLHRHCNGNRAAWIKRAILLALDAADLGGAP